MEFFLQQATKRKNIEKWHSYGPLPPYFTGSIGGMPKPVPALEVFMDSSIIADRRRLRRKLGFWRLIAVALIVALGFAFYRFALGDAG
ncbi:MAG: signal peptide peptidase SppA, partial [Rhizobium leguminosarum]